MQAALAVVPCPPFGALKRTSENTINVHRKIDLERDVFAGHDFCGLQWHVAIWEDSMKSVASDGYTELHVGYALSQPHTPVGTVTVWDAVAASNEARAPGGGGAGGGTRGNLPQNEQRTALHGLSVPRGPCQTPHQVLLQRCCIVLLRLALLSFPCSHAFHPHSIVP